AVGEHRASHGGGRAAGEANEVDRRLRMAGALQHAALAAADRGDVARNPEVARAAVRVDERADGRGAIRGGAPRRRAGAHVDRDMERPLAGPALARSHDVEPELLETFLLQRDVDWPASDGEHEV